MVSSFYEEHAWYFTATKSTEGRRRWAVRELREASDLSQEVLTRLRDIGAKLDALHVRAAELAQGARPADKPTRP